MGTCDPIRIFIFVNIRIFLSTCGHWFNFFIFPFKANGSLLVEKGRVVGSELLAQNITSKAMFRYRPSAASYGTLPSGASNLSPSSLDLKKLIEERILDLEAAGISKDECNELLYTSGSGLDPHITPICAYEQAKVLAKEGKVPLDQINELILKHTEYPLLGFVGRERINVTKLNLSWRQIIHE